MGLIVLLFYFLCFPLSMTSSHTLDQISVYHFVLFYIDFIYYAVSHVTKISVSFSRSIVNIAPINGNKEFMLLDSSKFVQLHFIYSIFTKA